MHVLARQEPLDRMGGRIGLDLGQVPELSEVDPEHRHRVIGDHAHRAQHGSVATEAHRQIASRRPTSSSTRARSGPPERCGIGGRQHHLVVTMEQPVAERAALVDRGRSMDVQEQRNS